MKCPNCRNQYNYKTERRPNGNTTCLICGTTAPTSEWAKRPKSKREKELETELAEARAKLDSKQDIVDQLRLDSEIYCDRLKEARAEITAKNKLIEQMKAALKVMLSDGNDLRAVMQAQAALEAAERGE